MPGDEGRAVSRGTNNIKLQFCNEFFKISRWDVIKLVKIQFG